MTAVPVAYYLNPNDFVDYDIDEALAMKKDISEYEYNIAQILAR